MKNKPFNIVILPPEEIAKKAMAVSKKLKKKGGLFVLDDKNYFSHITIYAAEFPIKNMPKIKSVLRDFAARTKPFRAASLKYRQNVEGYVDVSYRRSKQMKKLQADIISLINPLRERTLRPKDAARLDSLSGRQRRNLKRYGTRNIGEDYFPHITFTRLAKFDKSALAVIKKADFSFEVRKLGFFYLGENGTCRKLIATFDLVRK